MIVDFPQPEGPTKQIVSPGQIVKERPWKTSTSGREG